MEVLDRTGAEASNPGCPPRVATKVLALLLFVFSCKNLELKGLLALALFVTRVALADNHDVAVATNHSALLTDRLDAWVDLHVFLFSLSSPASPEGNRRYFSAVVV